MNDSVNNVSVQSEQAEMLVQQKLTEMFENLVEPISKVDDDILVKPKQENIKPEDLIEKF